MFRRWSRWTEGAHERHEGEPLVRISIANIVPRLEVKSADGSTKHHYWGTYDEKLYKEGTKRVQAIGGGAALTPKGKQEVIRRFKAVDFERVEENDARFKVPRRYEKQVLNFFQGLNRRYFETNPNRELLEELTGKTFGGQLVPTVTKDDLIKNKKVATRLYDVSRQPSPRMASKPLSDAVAPVVTRRLFLRHKLVVDEATFAKLRTHPAVRFLTKTEVKTTHGGRTKGTTKDGLTIADNIYE